MKKVVSVAVLFAVVIGLLVTCLLIRVQQAPAWQIKLDNYVRYQNDLLVKDPRLSGTVAVATITTARHPENFHLIGEKKRVVDNYYWLLENEDVLSSAPAKVICVLLENRTQTRGDDQTSITYQPLFLVYFSNTPEPDWLIYQGNNSSAVGCDLSWPR
jgi:hypothetical protein